MTTVGLILQLECFKKSLELNRPLALAAQSAHASKCERIFTHGLNSSGSEIGKYSTTPTYINPKKSPKKFAPIGKTGNKVFASTGKPHQTKYFEQGYKGFREEIGRKTDHVNLTLSANLKLNFENRSRGVIAVNKVSKDEYNSGLDAENSLKKSGLEKHFNADIFHHTESEKKEFYNTLALELQNELKKCLS